MEIWRLMDCGKRDASYNMALDEAIATFVKAGDAPPTLRFYGWDTPSVSIGAFQKLSDINLQYCKSHSIAIVRRPTGGRAILHGDELTYSFSASNNGFFSGSLLATYRALSSAMCSAFTMLGIEVDMQSKRASGKDIMRSPLCFRSTSYGEITCQGRKIVGSAQKRWQEGFLQQGSIPYSVDHEKIVKVFSAENTMQVSSALSAPIDFNKSMIGLKDMIRDFDDRVFRQCLKRAFEQIFSIRLVFDRPSDPEESLARQLAIEKYQSPVMPQSLCLLQPLQGPPHEQQEQQLDAY
jgi:lipoate-protein ligase A